MTEQTTLDRDRVAAQAVRRHHTAMARTLDGTIWSLTAATRSGRLQAAQTHRRELLRWCREQLLPHAVAEESTLYAAAGALPEGRLLVAGMLTEHRRILALVDELELATEPVTTASAARALQAVFEVHAAKEDEQLLPLLVDAPDVSVAELLGGKHERLDGESGAPA